MTQMQDNEEIEQDQVELPSSSSIASSSPPPSSETNLITLPVKTNDDEAYEYVDKEIDEHLICSECKKPLVDPISHNSCGNTFCSQCAEDVEKCPMCSEDDFKKNSSRAKIIKIMLDKLKVKCSMCKNIVLRGELKDHKENNCLVINAYKHVEELKLNLEKEFNEKTSALKSEYENLLNQTMELKSTFEEEFKEKNSKLQQEFDENNTKLEQLKLELEEEFKAKTIELEMKHEELGKSLSIQHDQLISQLTQDFQEKSEKLDQEFKSKEDVLKKQKIEFDSQVLAREKIENSNKPIHLNVRGKIMTVSLGDFIDNEREPDNLFKKMFNGEYPLYETPSKMFEDSVYYIDCDSNIFKHIIEWLKYGSIDGELSIAKKKSLLQSCQVFELTNICKNLLLDTKSEIKMETNSSTNSKISQIDLLNLFKDDSKTQSYASLLNKKFEKSNFQVLKNCITSPRCYIQLFSM